MILDTNAVSALLDNRDGIGDVLARADTAELPVIVLGEYHYGLLGSQSRAKLEPLFVKLVQGADVLVVDQETAREFAEIKDGLRRRGRPIPENDLWIAALARQHGQPVLSQDAHFDLVPGVKRVGW